MSPSRYRQLGSDLPFTDPRRAHGIAMEGYFWRFSDPRGGRVVVALCGVCRDARGSWANIALAAHPGAHLHSADLPRALADPRALGARAWHADGTPAFRGDGDGVCVDLGPQARLDVTLSRAWPSRRPALGGLGVAHLVPGLSQYWHPHLLGASVRGRARIGGQAIDLTGWDVYAEKNWGRGGFPARWWWGQAQAFERRDVAVAFAGGEVEIGPLRREATGVVVRLGERIIRLGNPLLSPARVHADGTRWTLHARGPRHAVSLRGRARPGDEHVLPVPDLAARHSVPGAHEHLAGRLTLVVRRRGRVVYAGESALAGLEVGARGPSGGDERREQLGGLVG